MDSSTRELIEAGALIGVLAIAAVISLWFDRRKANRLRSGDLNPRPTAPMTGISRETLEEQRAFVITQIADLNEVAWGRGATGDRQQAERTYQAALDALGEAEGDYRKLPPIVEMLVHLPIDLALSGAALVILRLGNLQRGLYVPEAVQAALTYTSAAIKTDPMSVDAWITRLQVATTSSDTKYRTIADDAMQKVRALNPNHPRFPNAESNYYEKYGTKAQYEASLRRMLELAPSPFARRAAYDRLAWLYASMNRRDEAIAMYQQLFREQPEGSAWTWHNYSIMLYNAKRYQEALDASNHALGFFEFGVARGINNKARQALGMPPVEPADVDA